MKAFARLYLSSCTKSWTRDYICFYQVFMSLVLLFIAMWRKLKYCSTYYVIWFQLRMCVTYFRSRSHDATITCHICTFRITYMKLLLASVVTGFILRMCKRIIKQITADKWRFLSLIESLIFKLFDFIMLSIPVITYEVR